MKYKFRLKLVALFISMWVLISCSSAQESLWLQSPDWSRGGFIGNTKVVAPVPFVVGSGDSVYFFLVDLNEETSAYSFDLVRMNSGSDKLDYFKISFGDLLNVKQPEIMHEGNGNLRLFWIASEGLYTLIVGEDGFPTGEPVLLSGSDVVSSYDMVRASDGSVVLWYAGSRRSPGIHALSQYDGSAQSVLVDPDGTLIRLRFDNRNQLHTAWVHYPFGYEQTEILYGVYDPDSGEFSTAVSPVFPLDLGPSISLDDFALGVDNSNVYLYWTTNVHAGPQAGDIRANYETFPIGAAPRVFPSHSILAPTIYSLEFDNSASDLKSGLRISLPGLDAPMTTKIQDFRTNVDPAGEVVLAVRSPAEHLWRKTREQVDLIYFDNGSPVAYQPLTFTSAVSTFPNVVIDQSGYVSLAWLEKQSSNIFAVYFASTDPKFVGRFKTVSFGERLNVVYAVLFGMLIGALLAPIAAAVWMFAPLAVLGLFSFIRRILPGRIIGYLSIAELAAAVGTVWFVKLAVLPLMTTYVPFSAWIPNIPSLVGDILRVVVPLLTLIVSTFVAWHFTYRRENNSSLYFILIYVATDALITTSIYAVLIYGTYIQ